MRARRRAVHVLAFLTVVTCVPGAAALDRPSTAVGPAGGPAATPAAVGFNFKATVAAQLDVKWSEHSGSSTEPCSNWSSAAGRSVIVIDGRISGHVDISAVGASRARDWATIIGLGTINAKASSSNRRLNEASGSTACPPTPAKTYPPPPRDCEKPGSGQSRDVVGQLALRAVRRQSLATLDDITSPMSEGRLRAVVVDGMPLRGWYKRCRVSRHAPDLPVNLAIPVDDVDITNLRALKPGRTYGFGDSSGVVACARPNEMSEGEKCSGSVSVEISLRRIRPGERFP